MDKSAREIREDQWAQLILTCNQSGLTKRAFCQQHGISEKTFYYRQRMIRLKLATERTEQKAILALPAEVGKQPRFAELSPSVPAECERDFSVCIRVSGIEVALSESVSEAFLTKLLRAASHAG
jgi:putative transposase